MSCGQNSCTKAALPQTNLETGIRVIDTKGLFDTDRDVTEYMNYSEELKVQVIEEIMETLANILETGVHGILVVVQKGRLDEKDRMIIQQLSANLFKDWKKLKVYIVFSHAPAKFVYDHERGIECVQDEIISGGTMEQYYELVGKNWKRIIFVDNHNPDDAANEEQKRQYLKDNQETADRILQQIKAECTEATHLQDIYNGLLQDYDQMRNQPEMIGKNNNQL